MKNKYLKIFVLIILVIGLFGCKKSEKKENNDKNNQNSSVIEHNKTTYINPNNKTSNNKLAFIVKNYSNNYDDLIITMDYDGLLDGNIDIHSGLKTDKLNISSYEYTGITTYIKIEDFSTVLNYHYSKDNNNEVILTEDPWIIKKNNLGTGYDIYYIFDDYVELEFALFNVSNKEELMTKFNTIKKVFNFYGSKNRDCVNAFAKDGNVVNLSEYNFLRDIVSKKLSEYGLNLISSRYIESESISIKIENKESDYDSNTFIKDDEKYELSFNNGTISDYYKSKFYKELDFGTVKVNVTNDDFPYYFIQLENSYIEINSYIYGEFSLDNKIDRFIKMFR